MKKTTKNQLFYLVFNLVFISLLFLYRSQYGNLLFTTLKPIAYLGNIVLDLSILMFFLSFVFLITTLGRIFVKSIRFNSFYSELTIQFGVGFIIIVLYFTILGHLQLLSMYYAAIFYLIIVISGYFECDQLLSAIHRKLIKTKRIFSKYNWLSKLICLYLIITLLHALLPQTNGDPLYYHLSSAWYWSQNKGISFVKWQTWWLQGGTIEYFFMIISLICKNKFVVLISAQLFHYFVGLLLSAIIVYKSARLFQPVLFSLLTVLCFITFSEDGMMFVRAKNDGFTLFFIISTCYITMNYFLKKKKDHFFLIYLFLLFSLSIKHTALFFLLTFIPILWICDIKWNEMSFNGWIKTHLWYLTLFLPVGLPVIARNWFYTGNPFFPAMNNIFKSQYMDSYIEDVVKNFFYIKGSLFQIIFSNVKRFVLAKIPFVVFALFPLLHNRLLNFLSLIIIGSFVVLCIVTGQGKYSRFAFYMFALLSISSITVLWYLKKRFTISRKWMVMVLCVLIVINSNIDRPFSQVFTKVAPFLFLNHSFAADFSYRKQSYLIQKWINENLEGTVKIFSFSDNECYFLNENVMLSTPFNNIEASQVLKAKSIEEFISLLHFYRFTHVQIEGDVNRIAILKNIGDYNMNFELLKNINGYAIYKLL